MEKDDYLKKQIIEDENNYFVYSEDTEERSNHIKNLVNNYPPLIGQNNVVATDVSDFGLKKTNINVDKINIYKLTIVSNEYLYLTILSNILKLIIKNNDINDINLNFNKFVNYINRYNKGAFVKEFSSVNEIIDVMDIDRNYYKEYVKTDMNEDIYSKVHLVIFNIDLLIKIIKEELGNTNHFSLIFNNKNNSNYGVYSYKSVNQLIGSKINNDISIKVFTEPCFWPVYFDLDDNYIKYVLDYNEVELEYFLNQYIEQSKKILKRS